MRYGSLSPAPVFGRVPGAVGASATDCCSSTSTGVCGTFCWFAAGGAGDCGGAGASVPGPVGWVVAVCVVVAVGVSDALAVGVSDGVVLSVGDWLSLGDCGTDGDADSEDDAEAVRDSDSEDDADADAEVDLGGDLDGEPEGLPDVVGCFGAHALPPFQLASRFVGAFGLAPGSYFGSGFFLPLPSNFVPLP